MSNEITISLPVMHTSNDITTAIASTQFGNDDGFLKLVSSHINNIMKIHRGSLMNPNSTRGTVHDVSIRVTYKDVPVIIKINANDTNIDD